MRNFLSTFSIIASIVGFIVDATTILSWFFNPNSIAASTPTWQLPVINVSLHLETVTLVILLYTLFVFGFLQFISSNPRAALYTFVSSAAIPFFFLWGSIFHKVDTFWVMLGSFLGTSCYVTFCSLFRRDLPIAFLVGLLLTPLATAWLHEGYQHGWLMSLALGVLIGFGGWAVLGLIALIRYLIDYVSSNRNW